jgi:hypothetical protein
LAVLSSLQLSRVEAAAGVGLTHAVASGLLVFVGDLVVQERE